MGHNGARGFTCERFMSLVRPMLPRIADTAAKIAAFMGADWFRLDAFVGHPALGLRVNEITYPSHVRDTCALQQWLRKYRELRVTSISSHVIFRRLSQALGIDNRTF